MYSKFYYSFLSLLPCICIFSTVFSFSSTSIFLCLSFFLSYLLAPVISFFPSSFPYSVPWIRFSDPALFQFWIYFQIPSRHLRHCSFNFCRRRRRRICHSSFCGKRIPGTRRINTVTTRYLTDDFFLLLLI